MLSPFSLTQGDRILSSSSWLDGPMAGVNYRLLFSDKHGPPWTFQVYNSSLPLFCSCTSYCCQPRPSWSISSCSGFDAYRTRTILSRSSKGRPLTPSCDLASSLLIILQAFKLFSSSVHYITQVFLRRRIRNNLESITCISSRRLTGSSGNS